jgi:hypothetical protein
MDVLARAADFVWRNARLLERVLFAHHFEAGPAEAVRAVVAAYRNPDGGFGHALEPDVRAPASQPLHGEVALRALQAADVRDAELALGACAFFATVAEDDGRLPLVLPNMLGYPRAAHWTEPDPPSDSPNPTAAITGLLLNQGVTHPWLEQATSWCWQRLEQPIDEAHAIRAALTFLAFAPDRPRAEALARSVAEQAFSARYFKTDQGPGGYGLTPLHLIPRPNAVGRSAFPDALLASHLDDLLATQSDDGGWPLTWEPPGPGAAVEWRGAWTLEALTTLRAYGRI